MTERLPCAPLDPSRNPAALAEAYVVALEGFDRALLDRSDEAHTRAHGLSGLFLPGISPSLHHARRRIMVVGAETAGWNVLKPGERFDTVEAYVERAMAKHEQFARNRFAQATRDAGLTFWNFMRDVGRHCGTDGLIYANLFCCDWKGGSPIRSPHFKTIQDYSARLLRAQVAFFAPSIIVFANGSASAGARRAVFPTKGPERMCSAGKDYALTHGIPKSQLWAFQLDDSIDCYRIQHPSSMRAGASAARRFLLTQLPPAMEGWRKVELVSECQT